MSAINDALKKVSQSQKSAENAQASGPLNLLKHGLPVDYLRKKESANWGLLFILLIVALITAPLVAPIFKTPARVVKAGDHTSTKSLDDMARSGTAFSQVPPMPVASQKRMQFGVEEAPLGALMPSAMQGSSNFILSGIVYSAKDAYCLVNGKIARPGGKIDGATLVSVSQDRAVLDYQGNKITLRMAD